MEGAACLPAYPPACLRLPDAVEQQAGGTGWMVTAQLSVFPPQYAMTCALTLLGT
jgi:hypothetical protein